MNAYGIHHYPAALFHDYRLKALALVRNLDVTGWQKIHEQLRIAAGHMDDNPDLYVLMRLWKERERLKGVVSGALWIRHIAEVIRRGVEEAHVVQWPEEDRAFGLWYAGGRLLCRSTPSTLRSGSKRIASTVPTAQSPGIQQMIPEEKPLADRGVGPSRV